VVNGELGNGCRSKFHVRPISATVKIHGRSLDNQILMWSL